MYKSLLTNQIAPNSENSSTYKKKKVFFFQKHEKSCYEYNEGPEK